MLCTILCVKRGDKDRAPRQVFRDHELQLSRHREAPRIIVIVRGGVPRFELQPGVLAPAAEALPMLTAMDGLVQVTVALHALQHQVQPDVGLPRVVGDTQGRAQAGLFLRAKREVLSARAGHSAGWVVRVPGCGNGCSLPTRRWPPA